ncbi:MAG: hypothetical protein ACAH12_09785 [Methylophilaceae bacterium]
MKPEILLELLEEIEKEDPIDFSGLPFDETDLRQLACLNVVELLNSLDSDAQSRENIMAATVTRLVLENMVLHARVAILLQDQEIS